MTWIKKNLIFKPTGNLSWSKTHAQVPTAIIINDKIRIYYATRDNEGRSLTSFIDVSKADPNKILYIHDKPILNLGRPGTHDEDGVMSGCFIQTENEIFFYYTGWSKSSTVPYRVSIGLAKSIDGGINFNRIYEGPIVDRTKDEPYMTMSPYVIKEDSIWKMWYGSGTEWVKINSKMEPIYTIKYAYSQDGLTWIQKNINCIHPLHPLEANTRPSVKKTDSGYEMWFSYRHSVDFRNEKGGYRIGYATSKDGINWTRHKDPSNLTISQNAWDSQMIAYPNVIEINGKKIMFYNGNGFGLSGFGYAISD